MVRLAIELTVADRGRKKAVTPHWSRRFYFLKKEYKSGIKIRDIAEH
jgi:hypothetical protein